MGQQVSTGLWWPEETLYHSAYSCVCQFFKAIQASHWCLWHRLRSCPLPDREDGTEAVIGYASRSLSKAESHYPGHKLEFLTLKRPVVEKFHKYLYGSTFNVHMDNNLLTYVLMTAKLDAASHHWVASLANYNFRLHYRAGKANIDADALSRVPWPGCMPDNTSTHIKVSAAAMQAVLEAALQGPASPIEAYSSNLHILDVLQDSNQVASMTLKDWCQAQEADPVLSLVITRLRDGMLQKGQSKATDPPNAVNLGKNRIILFLKGVSYTYRPDQGNWRRPSSSWFCQLHTGRLLSEDAMTRLVIWAWSAHWISCMTGSFWPCMAAQVKEHVEKCHPCLAFKARQPKALSKISWPHIL